MTKKEQEQVTKEYVEEIQEISNWLLTSYRNSLESLEPLLETARTVLEGMPGMIKQILWRGLPAGLKNAILRDHREHSCGYYLANKGYDTRLIQDYLGHVNIQNTVRYTRLNHARFKGFWD